MKNENLIDILRELPSDVELVIEVRDIVTSNILGNTYDISYDVNEYGELKLSVSIETVSTS